VFTAGEEPEDVTWGVQPSSAGGPDGRTTFDFAVAPGTLIEDWITVTNYSNQSAGFRVYASDATTDYDTAAFTLIGAEQASIDLGAWTQVDSGPAECPDTNDEAEEICAHDLGVRIALGPGESRTLPIAINVPFDATPGDHSAGVVASFEQEAAEDDGTTVLLEQRVGARVYLRVDGPLAASVGVSGVTASYDGVVNPVGKGAATVGFDITNTGNVRLSGVPDVRLTGPFGIDLGAVELEPVSNLLPGGTGHVTAKLPDVAPLFFLAAKVTVRPEPGDGAVGDVPLALDPVTGSAQTWAVPWSALGLIALLAGGSWFVVWRRRRSRQLLAAELAVYTEELLAGAGSGAGFAPAAAPAPGRRAFSAPARAWFPRRPRGSGWRPELGSLLGSKPVPRIPSGTAAIGAAR
jgi:LPXTG-motif cell wall-anchored protein